MSAEVNYDEEEKQVAIQAKDYLSKHGIRLSWHFNEDAPPTKEVEDFVSEREGDFFYMDEAESIFSDNAIEMIEFELSLEEKYG